MKILQENVHEYFYKPWGMTAIINRMSSQSHSKRLINLITHTQKTLNFMAKVPLKSFKRQKIVGFQHKIKD